MRRFDGSTLIEILIAFALFSLIMAVMLFSHDTVMRNSVRAMTLLDAHLRVAGLLDQLKSDLRGAAPGADAVTVEPLSTRVRRAGKSVEFEVRYSLDGSTGLVVRTAPGEKPLTYGSRASGWLVARFLVTAVKDHPDLFRTHVEAQPLAAGSRPITYESLIARRSESLSRHDLKWNLAYED